MIPGVEPILLDLENPFLPSRDLKNGRKTQKLEVKNFKIFEKKIAQNFLLALFGLIGNS